MELYCAGLLIFFSGCGDDDITQEYILNDEMLSVINDLRKSGCFCGEDSMPPVQAVEWSNELTEAATRHVKDMSSNGFLSHIGSDESTPVERAHEANYIGVLIGENIARGFISTHDVMEQWISSEAHCKIIMNGQFYFVGAASVNYYWTQVFGGD
jgi:uncharacterized protein YkwD